MIGNGNLRQWHRSLLTVQGPSRCQSPQTYNQLGCLSERGRVPASAGVRAGMSPLSDGR